MTVKIHGLLLLVLLSGCSPANFFGRAEKQEGTKGPVTTPQSPNNPKPDSPKPDSPDIITSEIIERPDHPGDGGGELKILQVQDQQVNTGGISSRYSESLEVPVTVTGGSGNVTLKISSSPQSPTLGLSGQKIVWRPGHYSGAAYSNEVGQYQVTLTATDAAGTNTSTNFQVKVAPVEWKSRVINHTNKDNMEFQYEISEQLHPSRVYRHSKTYDGVNLNASTCVSFTNRPDVVLLSGPTFTDGQAATTLGSSYSHKVDIKMVSPIATQPYDNTVFVTWLNFLAVDGSVQAHEDNGIFIYYAYSRCRDTKMSVNECKKASISSNNMDNFYYCSDYFPEADKKKFLKDLYCGFAKLHQVATTSCP